MPSCYRCGSISKRETDTMDTFVDSSWYYLRYPNPFNNDELVSKAIASQWTPVNIYIGGVEHGKSH